jgi:multiple sugar transport system substrate-binding protein
MRRVATVVGLLAALGLAAAGVAVSASQGENGGAPARAAKGSATELTVWVGWSARELSEFKKVVAEYDRKNADVTVKVVGGINDEKIIASLRAGDAPDVVSSFTSQNVGIYCSSGGWIDLAPYLKQDKIDINQFPAATRYYTQYKNVRCALPLLADVYGFYYNKKLFREAGLKGPPKSFAELTSYAKKLTKRNADGSLKVVGFDPFFGFYQNTAGAYQPLVGAKYFDSSGKSALGTDPAWQRLFTWQKGLIDYYGHSKLVRWQTGAGDEFSASHAFETGKLAMMMDGEWRVAFIAAEHPELQYGTAPMPTTQPARYGAGYVNGTIIGIPKRGGNRDEAWDLVKYLTTNDHALATFSNGIRNVPSTRSSSKSKELKADPNFATFARIFTHPKSTTIPITALGQAHLDTLQSFLARWQSGKVKDLAGGLREVDKQIDAKMKQAGGGPGGGPPK